MELTSAVDDMEEPGSEEEEESEEEQSEEEEEQKKEQEEETPEGRAGEDDGVAAGVDDEGKAGLPAATDESVDE